MNKTLLSGWFVATALACAVAAAQAAPQQGSPQYPQSSPPQSQQAKPQTPPPSTPSADQKSDAQSITVAGCVQKESDVLKRSAMAGNAGMGDEFVLTNASLTPAGAPSERPEQEAKPAAEPTGTSGASSKNFGKVYRMTGDKESELKSYIGQRVEIAGSFKKESDAQREMSPTGTSGAPAAELTTANTPEFTIASIKPLGSCPASAK